MKERWEEIPGFPTYLVSDLGNVVNMKYGYELQARPNQSGHIRVGLVQDGKQLTRSLALLVAEAFVPRPDDHFNTPIHLDGDLWNCRADNLMWRPRAYAVKFHQQFRLDTFHTDYQAPIMEIHSGRVYPSVKHACMDNGLHWYHVVKSYVEETFTPLTFQEFRLVESDN